MDFFLNDRRVRQSILAIMLSGCCAGNVSAASFYCPVDSKWDEEKHYSTEELIKYQFSLRIIGQNGKTVLQRCSFSPSRKIVDCDDYTVDHVQIDPDTSIKKYYYFKGHFDVQVFPNGKFIENNGRGTFASGTCQISDN